MLDEADMAPDVRKLHERAREFLPAARFERLEGGAISRPDLTAAVVRAITAAGGDGSSPASPSPAPAPPAGS